MKSINLQAESMLSGRPLLYWRIAQILVGLVGFLIFFALIFFPKIGLHAFWNVLIPVAPALVVVATGLWRNICPMASTALLPRHLGISKKKRIKVKWQGRLQLISVSALLLIIPLRHTFLDLNGPATALVIGILAAIAFYAGLQYDWKSAWCSGLCPVHPVEKLYGRKGVFVLPNAHCSSCVNCVSPCPDSTPSIHPLSKKKKTLAYRTAGILIIGGFPGYIWGWFHVQDYALNEGWKHLISTYAFPFVGMAVTLSLFLLLQKVCTNKHERILYNVFAAAAVSCYYWYRLPALIGFGLFPEDGMLVNLSHSLPQWLPVLLQISTSLFFVWWLVFKKEENRSWAIRPPYLKKIKGLSPIIISN